MSVKSDIEIAREASLQPIAEIGEKLDIPADRLLQYGPHKAKISYDFIQSGCCVWIPARSRTGRTAS